MFILPHSIIDSGYVSLFEVTEDVNLCCWLLADQPRSKASNTNNIASNRPPTISLVMAELVYISGKLSAKLIYAS
jgi:hypothetical protein